MNLNVSCNSYVDSPAIRDSYLAKDIGPLLTMLLDSSEISTRLRANTYDEKKVKEFEDKDTTTLTQRAFLTYVSFGTVHLTKSRIEELYTKMKTMMPAQMLESLKQGMDNFKDEKKVADAANAIKGYLVEKFEEHPLIVRSLDSLKDLRTSNLVISDSK